MENQKVLILDFGGQYNQLIARRVRECNVYCEVRPYNLPLNEIQAFNPIGIIFTGGPNSVYEEGAPKVDPAIFQLGYPVLGICYGVQVMAHTLGGVVEPGKVREYGQKIVEFDTDCAIFAGLSKKANALMSHNDTIYQLPQGWKSAAVTDSCPVAAMYNAEARLYGMQFHPEVTLTEQGTEMIRNFLYRVCGATGDWTMQGYAETAIREIQEKVGAGKVLLALSGGVDSSVVASLLQKAVGQQLTCIFVDHGLMRKNEGDEIEGIFGDGSINFIRINAEQRFLSCLAGITDPEQKRKIIGEEFIRIFEEEAKKIGTVDYLAQGTIYPDIIESGTGESAVIKSHHNVGGLPDFVDFKEIIEPLRQLFKDEVRALGTELGLPDHIVWRQPFPGPGLGIRVLGELTKEKLDLLREADFIFREEVHLAGLEREINQYFAVLTDQRSVGVMGDGRTYDYTIALRGVVTSDFMTAEWAHIPYEVLDKVSRRIVNEVKQVNRIVYDITSKPPATIEWE